MAAVYSERQTNHVPAPATYGELGADGIKVTIPLFFPFHQFYSIFRIFCINRVSLSIDSLSFHPIFIELSHPFILPFIFFF
jgi:hypothetical protein